MSKRIAGLKEAADICEKIGSRARRAEKIQAAIENYAADYEWRSENADGCDACHTPTEFERAMIVDALHGLLADDEFLAAFRAASPQPASQDVAELVTAAKEWLAQPWDAEGLNHKAMERLRTALARWEGKV